MAGFRRQEAGRVSAGLVRQAAISASAEAPTAQGMLTCGISCPLWRSVRWTVREERTSPTNGRDTTACFAGGE
ncbi:hypothetical protein AAAY25_05200 [Brotaphodocola catenula]|uniref:hypothetical protein n=1 Tax=Lachnospiraceae TaxID=186803 RepID=UPI0027D239E7|nr:MULTISPECIES: hypothetical protein [Lachnospiraceae]MBT9773729.1 hypothetical protein [Coprococcus catus]